MKDFMDNQTVKLLQGDCLELMKTIPDGSVDLVLTDPPYGTTQNKWDSIIDLEMMWKEVWRVLKPNGACVLFGGEPFSSALRMSDLRNYKYDWVWEKSKPTGHLNAKKQPLRKVENILVFYKKQCLYNPQGIIPTDKLVKRTNRGNYGDCSKTTKQTVTNYPRNILRYPSIDGVHQTQKPVELMEYLIKTYTNESETVLDFTMGSGTTGVACINTDRKFIGIELDETYFNIAKERIEDAQIKLGGGM